MFIHFLILFFSIGISSAKHFNGGTISWAPIDPYDNSSPVTITITQSYSWTYPYIRCADNVPASTPGWASANTNLTCVVDCTTDGGYSTKPINILTDCKSTSTSLNMMSTERSNNITLIADAHFYLAYVGRAWVALNYPPMKNLEWSIATYIDLRKRSDGFINTPPVAKVVSPQYAIVNQTVQISIPVSDANIGDDVRCRWSTYTSGYRRRKRSDNEESRIHHPIVEFYQKVRKIEEIIHRRQKRSCSLICLLYCFNACDCSCNNCDDITCNGSTCTISGGCPKTTTAASTTAAPTTAAPTTTAPTTTSSTTMATTTTTTSTTTTESTTIETLGTLRSTSSYPIRQAIDECGDICYPGSVPSGTTLSNCVISFTGTRADVWYAVAIQVEDFINDTSMTPMSSVPVQLLIYVMGQPKCSKQPVILPLNGCLEVQVGVAISFDLYAINLCDPNIAKLTDIVDSDSINGMIRSNLTTSATNTSLSYIHFTWIPQANQIGYQELCAVAYTQEQVQSNQYCAIFTVKTTPDLCVTTTTTTSTTTSATTTTTSSTTSTTASTTTTTTTTTTTSTSTTSTSTSSATTSTSTTTTSTTTSTSTTTTSTSSTSTTSTTSTTTSTTSTSTTSTTTSVTTTTSTTTTTTKAPESTINWPLIVGLSLLGLLLSLCCCCYCLYRFYWAPATRRHRRKEREIDIGQQPYQPRYIIDKTRVASRLFRTNTSNKNHDTYDILHSTDFSTNSQISITDIINEDDIIDIEKDRRPSTISIKRIKCINLDKINENENERIKSSNSHNNNEILLNIPHSANSSVQINKVSKLDQIKEEESKNSNTIHQERSKTELLSQPRTSRVHITKISRNKSAESQQISSKNINFKESIPLEMQPIRNRSKTISHIPDMKKDYHVTVSKLSKKLTTTRSDQ